MPMIPPPVMSALKIQVKHIVMDANRKSAWNTTMIPTKLTAAPLKLKKNATDQITGEDGIDAKSRKALENSNNVQKLDLVQNGNVKFARMIDQLNVTAYNAGGAKGFNSLMYETESPSKVKNYWYNDSERTQFKTVNDCKVFENSGVRNFNGNPDDDAEVKKYVNDMTNNKASWSTLLLEYSKALGRLITKILIFISKTVQKLKLAIRASLTLLTIMEESFDWTSSAFQTVLTVGGPVSQVSVITT